METLRFECVGMKDGGHFPVEHTGRGKDLSPEILLWNISPAARTLAVTLEDITHPLFKDFTHWLIWNIPAGPRIPGALGRGRRVPGLDGARQGLGYGLYRYAGPKPPRGRQHSYRFTVYALDSEVELTGLAVKRSFLKRAEGHILQRGSIVCDFGA